MHYDTVNIAIEELNAVREYNWQGLEDKAVYKAGLMKWLGEPVR